MIFGGCGLLNCCQIAHEHVAKSKMVTTIVWKCNNRNFLPFLCYLFFAENVPKSDCSHYSVDIISLALSITAIPFVMCLLSVVLFMACNHVSITGRHTIWLQSNTINAFLMSPSVQKEIHSNQSPQHVSTQASAHSSTAHPSTADNPHIFLLNHHLRHHRLSVLKT